MLEPTHVLSLLKSTPIILPDSFAQDCSPASARHRLAKQTSSGFPLLIFDHPAWARTRHIGLFFAESIRAACLGQSVFRALVPYPRLSPRRNRAVSEHNFSGARPMEIHPRSKLPMCARF